MTNAAGRYPWLAAALLAVWGGAPHATVPADAGAAAPRAGGQPASSPASFAASHATHREAGVELATGPQLVLLRTGGGGPTRPPSRASGDPDSDAPPACARLWLAARSAAGRAEPRPDAAGLAARRRCAPPTGPPPGVSP